MSGQHSADSLVSPFTPSVFRRRGAVPEGGALGELEDVAVRVVEVDGAVAPAEVTLFDVVAERREPGAHGVERAHRQAQGEVDVAPAAAAMDRGGAARLRWPEAEERLAAERQPHGGPLVPPALGDGETNHLPVEALGGRQIGYL